MEPVVFKKEYLNKKGDLVKVEHHRAKTTINDEFTNDMEETKKDWSEEADLIITKDFEKKIKLGDYIKYIVKNKKGKEMARVGGIATKKTDKFFMLMNGVTKVAWSVQYENVVVLYQMKTEHTPKNETPESKELRIKQKEIKKKLRKEKIDKMKERAKKASEKKEEKQDAKEEKQEAKDDKENQLKDEEAEKKIKEKQLKDEEAEKKKSPTNDEIDKILHKLYYDENLTYGRDKLFKTTQERGLNIPRHKIEKWLKSQKLYQMTKPAKKQKNFQIIQSKDVNKVWNIDLVEIQDAVVLACIDSFSRYAYGRVIPNKTSLSVVNGLKSIFKEAKTKPSMVVSDNGPEFIGRQTEALLKTKKIKHLTTTPHNPQANGKIERLNRTMKDLFKKMNMKSTDESLKMTQKVLSEILISYNTSYHSKIKMSPIEALKEENQEKVESINKKHASFETINADDIKVGDKVRTVVKHENKEAKQYRANWSEEVYEVKTIRRPKNILARPIQYKLQDTGGLKKEHRGYFTRNEIQVIGDDIQGEDKMSVKHTPEKIVKEKGDEYMIKWKGFRASESTWENKEELKKDIGNKDYDIFVKEFNKATA